MQLLTSNELAEKLGLTEQAVILLRERQGMPYFRISRKNVRYDWETIQDWLKQFQKVGGEQNGK